MEKWNGKHKAITLSYDDGVGQDERLIAILNHYGIKATFNLNSGIQSGTNFWTAEGVDIRRINLARLPDIYKGHEPAVHSLTHPFLERFDEPTIYNEIHADKENLRRIFGCEIHGMAYPFGTYNDLVVKVVGDCGLKYARTTERSGSFALPEDLLRMPATCHHKDADFMDLTRTFVELETERPQLFYLWGHSYEFDVDRNWQLIEDFCRLVSGREDIFFGTNAEVLPGD